MSIVKNDGYMPKYHVPADSVLNELRKYMLVDGFDFILDLEKSHSSYFVEARTGKKYLDFFTCFASMPLGVNHPKMNNKKFNEYISRASLNKISNADIYTSEMATFVKTFFKVAVPDYFRYAFFIDGGALAVENALKTAFDWKVRLNFRKGFKYECGHQIIHFKRAFHGRSGYTMSLTNTEPRKVELFPKFEWPRIINPSIVFPLNEENLEKTIKKENMAIEQIKESFRKSDCIAAIIIEPIQGEGGDNHFRPEFLQQLRHLADENETLLIFDEVQTGLGLTGTMWAHQQLGVQPDIMCFGKKMQTCGIVVTDRVDEVKDNVFQVSSRINSTWGGNLVDMIRATKYLEIIEEENLIENVKSLELPVKEKLNQLQEEYPEIMSNVRGRGLMCAFDLPSDDIRKMFIERSFEEGLFILGCGEHSIRFRPALNITLEQIDEGMEIIRSTFEYIRKH
jgi:L-lysine 6-transaminase